MGIYTCEWIANNPTAAAQARVTCSLSQFFAAAPLPAAVVRPAGPTSIDATGCVFVPDFPNRVGPGVFAWSDYKYANDWTFYPEYGPPVDYTAYVQKLDGTNKISHEFNDFTHRNFHVPANNDRWGAQNHINPAQEWHVCYDVT